MPKKTPHLSVLNLVNRFEGETPKEAIQRATDLLQAVEEFGYKRFWVAEHHNFAGVTSGSPTTMIQHFLQQSKTIKVGAGGIMIPNHTTLQVAETFGTLEHLYPGRVDLGLGRAPGTDHETARIIYRGDYTEEGFKKAIAELRRYFGPQEEQGKVIAYPAIDTQLPLFVLGSSPTSAAVAAELGLPYSYAAHFATGSIEESLEVYRENFKPSASLKEPYLILGVLLNTAETEEESDYLFTAAEQAFLATAKGDRDTTYAQPNKDFKKDLTSAEKLYLESQLGIAIKGDPDQAREIYQEIQEKYQADELIAVSYIPTTEQLIKAYEILAKIINPE